MWAKWIGLYDANYLKQVPWPILMSGRKYIKSFIKGLTLDGYVSKESARVFVHTTINFHMAQQTCQLLRILGYRPNIVHTADAGEMTSPVNQKIYPTQPAW